MCLVLPDRASDRAAPVGLLRLRLGEIVLRDEEIPRRHGVVREAAEQRAVEDVAALLGDRIDNCAGGAAELGVVLVGEHLEFLHRLERRAHLAAARAAEIVVVVAGAVDREVAAPVAAAADDQRLTGERGRRRGHLDARRQADGEHPVLVHDRQRRDLGFGDVRADLLRGHVHERRGPRHGDAFLEAPYAERDVEGRGVADLDHQVGPFVLLEPGQVRGDLVGPRNEIGQEVRAVGVADDLPELPLPWWVTTTMTPGSAPPDSSSTRPCTAEFWP